MRVKDALADGTFCRLGAGRLDLAALLDALRALEYEGWIVVEQDVPDRGQDLGRIIGDMRHNRAVHVTFGNPYFFGADSGFEHELLAFHSLVTAGTPALSGAAEGAADIRTALGVLRVLGKTA